MKAQNLAISIPYNGCNKNCPYCISKMTGYTESNWDLMMRNMSKVKQFARSAQISNILITSKGEPCRSMEQIYYILEEFKEFPLELQTNGIKLSKCVGNTTTDDGIKALHMMGLDVLAVSIDQMLDVDNFTYMFMEANKLGLNTRITVNITDRFICDPQAWVIKCKQHNIDQLSFRKITIPRHIIFKDSQQIKVAEWIKKHVTLEKENEFFTKLDQCLHNKARVVRKLPYGATLYDWDGISVTWFDYCIQDQSNDNDVRSLIFQEDGHLYLSWNSPASRLF